VTPERREHPRTYFGGPTCVCGHAKNVHRSGHGTCGYYDEDAVAGRFDANGRAVRVKRGQCNCIEFQAAGTLPPPF